MGEKGGDSEVSKWQPKIGDRVAAYNNGQRVVGTVTSIEAGLKQNSGPVVVSWDVPTGIGWISVHPKQCRKLVKRTRRRIWVRPDTLTNNYIINGSNLFAVSSQPQANWVEFVEVRPKP